MRLLRGKKEKPKTDLQEYAEKYKDEIKAFHKLLNDSRYSIYAIADEDQGYIWEANFCGEWLIANPQLNIIFECVKQHYIQSNRQAINQY